MKHTIFDPISVTERVPEEFNAVKVHLEAGLKSDLSWKDTSALARSYIEAGLKIFWEIDLGLFQNLKYPLTHHSQFMSLKISLDHFRDYLWKEFGENSVGVSLYHGSADFFRGYLWDQEQEQNLIGWLEDHFSTIGAINRELGEEFVNFASLNHLSLSRTEAGKKLLQLYCRDAVAEYLDLLASRLPLEARAFLLVDTAEIADTVHLANLLSKEHFPHLSLVPKGTGDWWEIPGNESFFLGRTLREDITTKPEVAVCLPSHLFKPSDYPRFSEVFSKLAEKKIPFKMISEALLTAEWEGLDFIVVSHRNLSSQGRRMLMGFCAAGGTVVAMEDPIGLPHEIPFSSI